MPRIHLGDYVERFVDFLRDNFDPLFDVITTILTSAVDNLEALLLFPPAWVIALVAALVAWRARSLQFGAFTVAAFLLIESMGLWADAMSTLALVTVASIAALALGIPLGIAAARNGLMSAAVRPVLDFMQTLPVFVYLIPAILLFGIGEVPGAVATLVFAMPPAVRLTELGIRQVDAEVVEAAEAFGATDNEILLKVQVPLALPTIMAGVNQVIMLALSMVVIAGMIGAGGLGSVVIRGITRLDLGLGFEGGLAVVLLAIFLDRLTEALGVRANPARKGTEASA
jgi:glycine betaine/proline transport system permease protein